MTLAELQDGQVVRYRHGRAGRTEVEWGAWESGPIYVRRREKALARRYHRQTNAPNAGDIITIATTGFGAEYSQGDYSPEHNTFNTEDYYFQIEGLTA